jgi:hypothetical protein
MLNRQRYVVLADLDNATRPFTVGGIENRNGSTPAEAQYRTQVMRLARR